VVLTGRIRTTQADPRFVDYFGATDPIVTSAGTNDSGMFETMLTGDRFLPFEGAGAAPGRCRYRRNSDPSTT